MKQDLILTQLQSILQQNEKPLTLSEAAAYLDISKSQLYKITAKNQIKFYKPGGKKIYFKKNDLNNYLFRNVNKTDSELEQAAVDYTVLSENK